MALALVLGVFAGCAGFSPEKIGPFAVYRVKDNQVIKLGDTRDYVEKLLGPDERFVVEFEEENTERVDYWDSEGIYIEYDMSNGTVCAIRFENSEYKIFNGLTAGVSSDEAKKLYDTDMIHYYDQYKGFWLSYDESGNVIPYSEDSPFGVRVATVDSAVSMIVITDNSVFS